MTAPETMRTIRKARGIRQGVLAEALGISQPFLNDMELGRRPMPPQLVDRVVRALSLSPTERRELHLQAARDRGFDV
jgi:transcriptional regulator with XRE-family HTH domain